jgi:hypothetical protein
MRVLVVLSDHRAPRARHAGGGLGRARHAGRSRREPPRRSPGSGVRCHALIEHHPPAIDGLRVAAEIRSSRGPGELPIVLIVSGLWARMGHQPRTAGSCRPP